MENPPLSKKGEIDKYFQQNGRNFLRKPSFHTDQVCGSSHQPIFCTILELENPEQVFIGEECSTKKDSINSVASIALKALLIEDEKNSVLLENDDKKPVRPSYAMFVDVDNFEQFLTNMPNVTNPDVRLTIYAFATSDTGKNPKVSAWLSMNRNVNFIRHVSSTVYNAQTMMCVIYGKCVAECDHTDYYFVVGNKFGLSLIEATFHLSSSSAKRNLILIKNPNQLSFK